MSKRLFQIHDLNDLSKIENFFELLGHKNGRFVIHADPSWLTPKSLWRQKGNLLAFNKPVSLFEIFKIAERAAGELLFQVQILGANRAPIEGYLSPLLKTIERQEALTIENTLIKVPDNILFFFQFDSDDYTAKRSEWLNSKFSSLNNIPSLEKLQNKIAIPLDVLREFE